MSDQPINDQPKLSIEEELDVLEAVYKIGKEKGLQLLRPDHIKKLVDSGRVAVEINKPLPEIEPIEDLTVEDVRSIHANVRAAVSQILSSIDTFYPEIETSSLDKDALFQLRNDLFFLSFGKSPQDYAFDLFMSLTNKEEK